ncbi:hypothetical protein M9H77_30730 [Catharanthus roseus]|uniref:Uncharacterized protein n=1 Tax=Catharanthus roseus TaxID=4058 RepID=A0ACC0A2C9_CATRO|nr:hypothetical protein M9H77_30730 [Catharanthus roseus]
MLFVDIEEFNCDVINHSSCVGDDFIFLECLEEEDTCKDIVDFGFVCYSSNKGKGEKAHTKVDFRSGCKAMIEFRLNDDDYWTVSRHDVSHNHGFCDVNQRHFMHSQRQFTKNNAGYLRKLKDSEVSITTGLSFEEASWRFASMGNNHPITLMTDQSAAMAAAIGVAFPIVSEWRSNTKLEDFRCKEGYVEMMVTESKFLKHVNEVGLAYAMRASTSSVGNVRKVSKNNIAGYSAWRRKMLRKFSNLISANKLSVEERFRMMNDNITFEVGLYYVDSSNNEVDSSIIKDPVRRRAKGERNIRKKSILDIKYNQARVALRFTMFTATSTMSSISKLAYVSFVVNFGPSKHLSSWLSVGWLDDEAGACCMLCISCSVHKIGNIPERSFLKMHMMSMLSAFNSSHASIRLTTLFSNTLYIEEQKMHKRSLKGNLQRSKRSHKITRDYEDEVIKLNTLKTRRLVREYQEYMFQNVKENAYFTSKPVVKIFCHV